MPARQCRSASSLPLNLAVYVVSGVFQPLFIMEMSYAGVGNQLGLLCTPLRCLDPHSSIDGLAILLFTRLLSPPRLRATDLLPYYAGMACVLPFASRPLRPCAELPLPWRKLCGITLVDFVSQWVLMEGLSSIGPGLCATATRARMHATAPDHDSHACMHAQ